jgi:N-acetylglucosamine kinase-like BadF-type ATPase
MRVLGIDSGGTKTVCYLADETGRVLSEARVKGAPLSSAGRAAVETSLRDVIGRAMGEAPAAEVHTACLGMAGVDRPGETAVIREIVSGSLANARLVIVNDALVALEAGAPARPGIVVISGTGSIAYGRDGRGRAARAGGWGFVLADEGSGYWLGRQAVRAVMRQADGRGMPTSLTERLLSHYQVARAQDLIRKVYTGRLEPAAIARLASTVEEAAVEGDRVAGRIIEVGADELAGMAASVAARLELSGCDVVLAGGIFRAVPRMCDAVTAQLASRLPGASARRLDVEPALGAVRLGLRAAAGDSVVPVYVGED